MKAAAFATIGVAAALLLPWALVHVFGPFTLPIIGIVCLWALFYLFASSYEVNR